jgi:hippurate hydrolase
MNTSKIDKDILDGFEYFVKTRRHIHSYPEVGPVQNETVKYIKKQFANLEEVVVIEGDPKAGIVIDIICKGNGPIIAFRADMDALDVEESKSSNHFPSKNNFCSKVKNKMHACGHDIHTAILIGFGHIIYKYRKKLNGKIRLLFQPGEEGYAGGRQMVNSGYLDGVQNVFALHNWPSLEVGQIGFKKGPFFASIDHFDVKISGKGGHAAAPERASDQILAMSRVINDLQSIISRRISGLNQAVLSVCYANAGVSTANNVIPQYSRFGGSVRTFDIKTQNIIEKEFRRICEYSALSVSPNCKVEVEYKREYPQVINDDEVAKMVENVFSKFIDKQNLFPDYSPTLGAEDFSFMLDKVPGLLFLIGGTTPSRLTDDTVFLHNPSFDVDERAMLFGIQAFKNLAFELLCEQP